MIEDTNKKNEIQKSEPSHRSEAPPPEGFGEADYYLNEQGLLVFTEKYLLERGYCCGSGCKHCPYNYEAVPEPKRSLLRAQRNSSDKFQR